MSEWDCEHGRSDDAQNPCPLCSRDRRIADLEDAIKRAPHTMGCHSIQPEFQNTEQWATLEYCDCWKRRDVWPLETKL